MKPEQILQSDVLDILFFNRNKMYGAYELRRQYNQRLLKALTVMLLMVLLVYIWQTVKAEEVTTHRVLQPVVDVHLDPVTPVDELKKPMLLKKPVQALKEQVTYVDPEIVKDNEVNKEVPEMDMLVNKLIGSFNRKGDTTGGETIVPPIEGGSEKGDDFGKVVEPVVEEAAILEHAQVMPEFPGGKEAFMRYMHRNLREPELAAGEKILVRVKFVVDANGDIMNVEVIESGGYLDAEVLRVIKKMPRWKPGKQNGRAVAVYFQLPVTFLPAEY